MGVFDSSNEASGCTDHNAKNLNSLQCAVAEKIKKNPEKWHFFQKWPFLVFFPDFFSNCTFLGVGVFCVVTSASRRFIWAIKHPHTMIFIFLGIMGIYRFSDPRYRRWDAKIYFFSKYFPFSYGIRHIKPPRA